jgi:alpha-tubulin suppressor-like RCC1 family protein
VIPTKISDFKFKSVSAGADHTVALDFKGNIWVFGSGKNGQLGLGYKSKAKTPKIISFGALGLPDLKFKAIEAGDYHTVALDSNDNIWINLKILS